MRSYVYTVVERYNCLTKLNYFQKICYLGFGVYRILCFMPHAPVKIYTLLNAIMTCTQSSPRTRGRLSPPFFLRSKQLAQSFTHHFTPPLNHSSHILPPATICMRLPTIQQPAHLFETDRFRHEEIDAAGEGFALVSARGEARERDDQRW